ncbi:hypothetical protein RJT34_17349 [Clitoria ternatea]|uniref:Uncharacterized protein n=1 Tax=Clitoria ternatea TaxID=43366 RepID=A0AAN9J8T9_CLITE
MSSHEGSNPVNKEVQSADVMVMDDSNVSKAIKGGTPSTQNEIGSESLTPNANEYRDKGKKRKLTSEVWNHFKRVQIDGKTRNKEQVTTQVTNFSTYFTRSCNYWQFSILWTSLKHESFKCP